MILLEAYKSPPWDLNPDLDQIVCLCLYNPLDIADASAISSEKRRRKKKSWRLQPLNYTTPRMNALVTLNTIFHQASNSSQSCLRG